MKTLFVEKKAMEIRYERACLLLYHDGKRVSSVPLAQLERIVSAPHVALSAGVLGLVAEKNVALLVLNTRYPDRTALLSGTMHGDIRRRLAQYQCHQDVAFRLHWSIFLVKLKILRHYRLLLRLRLQRPDLRYPLTHDINALEKIIDDLCCDDIASTLLSLRGKEGGCGGFIF